MSRNASGTGRARVPPPASPLGPVLEAVGGTRNAGLVARRAGLVARSAGMVPMAYRVPASVVRDAAGLGGQTLIVQREASGVGGPTLLVQRMASGVSDGGDVIPSRLRVDAARAEAEAGRRRTIAAAVEALERAARNAGDVRAGTANGVPPGMDAARWAAMSPAQRDAWFEDHASQVFDPSDPAAMTRAQWERMTSADRRAWLEANVADSQRRAELIRSAIDGAFAQVGEVVRTIRETRLTEIREAAQTERARIAAELEGEKARLDAEVRRAQVEADRARADADRAAAEQNAARDAETRQRAAEAEAAARARAAESERAAELAAAERRRIEAEQRALATVGGSWSTGAMIAVGVGVTGGVLAVLALVWRSMQAPPAPPVYAGAMR